MAKIASEAEAGPDVVRYAELMEELKRRLAWAEAARQRSDDAGRPVYDRVFDYEQAVLQVRLCCELVALAALLAHNEIGLTPDLNRMYQPGALFQKLSEINPACFPLAVQQRVDGETLELSPIPDRLNRQAMKRIWDDCGRILHRGNLRDYSKSDTKHYSGNQLRDWIRALVDLLNVHFIEIASIGKLHYVSMSGSPKGNVAIGIAFEVDALTQP